jgi:hypothetical protein
MQRCSVLASDQRPVSGVGIIRHTIDKITEVVVSPIVVVVVLP